jgi:hypothetical protein
LPGCFCLLYFLQGAEAEDLEEVIMGVVLVVADLVTVEEEADLAVVVETLAAAARQEIGEMQCCVAVIGGVQ